MFNKENLKAFTVAELLISLIIMSLTMVFTTSVLFKKDKTPKRRSADKINKAVCFYKSDPTVPGQLEYREDGNYCDFELNPDMMSKEFIEVQLIGAGASYGYKSSAGEEKTVIYPSLQMPFGREGSSTAKTCDVPACKECDDDECKTCEQGYKLENGQCEPKFVYRAIIGQPKPVNPDGTGGGNGGETIFAVVDKSADVEKVMVLETAAGGTVSNETCLCRDENGTLRPANQDLKCDECENIEPEKTSSERGWGNAGVKAEQGQGQEQQGQPGEVRISW